MGLPWTIAEKRINESAVYAKAFKKIYGDIFIDSLKIASVLAQYQRTLLSNNSKFDAVMRGEMNFTPNEKRGWTIFLMLIPYCQALNVATAMLILYLPICPFKIMGFTQRTS